MALQYFEVPAIPSTPQLVTTSLSGVVYQFSFTWNNVAQCWFIEILDENGVSILSGIPLITGADLLAQYAYLQIPGSLVVQSDNDPNLVPGFDTLGDTGHLFYITVDDT